MRRNIWRIAVILIFMLGIVCKSTYAFDISKNSDLLVLVNNSHTLSREYVNINSGSVNSIMPSSKNIVMRKEAVDALEEMYSKMTDENINVTAISGFRNYNYQSGLFKNEVDKQKRLGLCDKQTEEAASAVVARPGASEHQTGLAIDVSDNGVLSRKFADTQAGKWLGENCYKYGFIMRYTAEKQDITGVIYEPWHLRYIGSPHSEYMYNNNLCFEEYIELLQSQLHITIPQNDGMKYDVYYTTDTSKDFQNIIDISRDNCGGYIITTYGANDIYKDIEGYWAEEYIREIVTEDNEIINPDKILSISEFVKYAEVDISRLYKVYKTVDLGRGITRQEAIYLLAGNVKGNKTVRLDYSDSRKIEAWAFYDIQRFVAMGLINGYEDNTIRPEDTLSLGEACKLICEVNRLKNESQ